ncbi:MAG: class I SAM-dependent methyltransferase [Thermodesulfobacteriota bacterium]
MPDEKPGYQAINACRICRSRRVGNRFRLPAFTVRHCRDCGVVFLSPMPTPETLAGLYAADYYQERQEYFFGNIVADQDHGKEDANIQAFRQGLARLAGHQPRRGRLLDIGCGPGIFLAMAREAGWQVQGVDVSAFAARYARERFGIPVRVGADLTTVALPAGSFAAITLWDALEHFLDPLTQLRAAANLLAEGGILMLDVPNEASLLRILARGFYLASGGLFTYPVRKLYHGFHVHYFDARALTGLLERASLELVALHRKPIPVVKARGKPVEKLIVRLLSGLEQLLGMEYELIALARRRGPAA